LKDSIVKSNLPFLLGPLKIALAKQRATIHVHLKSVMKLEEEKKKALGSQSISVSPF